MGILQSFSRHLVIMVALCVAHNSMFAQLIATGVETPQSCPPGVSEQTWNYTLYLPNNYHSVEKCPVYIHLHGNNGAGDTVEDFIHGGVGLWGTGKLYQSDSPWVVIRPRCQGVWNVEDLHIILHSVMGNYKCDPDRVYLSGYSFGGRGSWDWLAYETSLGNNTFASIATSAAAKSKLYDINEILSNNHHMGIWLLTGDQDPLVNSSITRSYAESLVRAGAEARLTVWPDKGHNVYCSEFKNDDYIDWINSKERVVKALPASKVMSINFCQFGDEDGYINEVYGLSGRGSVMGNWNNVTAHDERLILNDGASTEMTVSWDNASLTTYGGLSGTPLQAGLGHLLTSANPTNISLKGLSSEFNGRFKVIMFLTGERPEYVYQYDGDKIAKDVNGDFIYSKIKNGNTAARISDGNDSFYYRAPDIFGGQTVNNYPYMLMEGILKSAPEADFPEATFVEFGPYQSIDKLTFSIEAISGGATAVGGMQIVSLEQEAAFSPAQATFEIEPTPTSSSVAKMKAIATSAFYPPVEYHFVESSDDNLSSEWQENREFIVTGLRPGTNYEYTLWVRDTKGNMAVPSKSIALTTPEDTGIELIGWHTPIVVNGLVEPDLQVTGVNAIIELGNVNQWKETVNSTDQTFGTIAIPSLPETANGFRLVVGNESNKWFTVQVYNQSEKAIFLKSLHFDYSRINNVVPRKLEVRYIEGNLAASANQLLFSFEDNESDIIGSTGDFVDVDVDLMQQLSDYELAHNEKAVFEFRVDDAADLWTGLAIDNLAMVVETVENTAISDNMKQQMVLLKTSQGNGHIALEIKNIKGAELDVLSVDGKCIGRFDLQPGENNLYLTTAQSGIVLLKLHFSHVEEVYKYVIKK